MANSEYVAKMYAIQLIASDSWLSVTNAKVMGSKHIKMSPKIDLEPLQSEEIKFLGQKI